ncbi:DMT family transporter [Kangiella sp. TOML190]|uniref:DMT family transporter n=1 Tax=Kangiella sp. TOML190 TaxID=2931351 RepID=UPI0020421F62|nr:DMT family transporter [Kangiella sp. TOML190]
MGLGEILALACAVCWAIGIVLFKHSGETLTANSLNLLKNCIGLLLIVPTAMVFEGLKIPNLSVTDWLIVIASGYFGIAIADSWYFQALRRLGAGRTAIVASLYSPFVIILSIILLGERLQSWQWLGLVLVLVGILLVIYQKHYQYIDKQELYRGSAFACAAVFLTALGVVAVKPIFDNDSNGFFWIVAFRLIAGVVGALIFLILKGKLSAIRKEVVEQQHNWPILVTASVFATYFAMLFWLGGFKYTDASIASVLNETSNIFIVLLAWLFLKEAFDKRKFFGVTLAFAGVMVFLGF